MHCLLGREWLSTTRVSKEILPEMSALVLKKGWKKPIKCSIKDTLLFFHVASLGPFEVKMFLSYSLIGIVLYFITFSCVFASTGLNPGTSADQEQYS